MGEGEGGYARRTGRGVYFTIWSLDMDIVGNMMICNIVGTPG